MKTKIRRFIARFKMVSIEAGILLLFVSFFFSIDALSQSDRTVQRRNSTLGEGRQRIQRDQSIRQQMPGAAIQRGSEYNNLNRSDDRRFSQKQNNNRNLQGQVGRSYENRRNINRSSSIRDNSAIADRINPDQPVIRIDDNTFNRPGNNINRRGISAYNKPGNNSYNRTRPYYNHNNYRRSIYSAHNPNWCYAYTPRRNSIFYTLPSSYININFGGFGYRYYDGIYYRPYNRNFRVVAPPIGIYINALPVGYRKISVGNYPYYYYNGTYYDYRDNNYTVVSPPVGAVVESIPDGFETLTIGGETYYTVDGAQYKPVVQESGEIWYEVVKSNS